MRNEKELEEFYTIKNNIKETQQKQYVGGYMSGISLRVFHAYVLGTKERNLQ